MRSEFWDDSVEVIRRMKAPMRPHPSEIRELWSWLLERMAATSRGDGQPRGETLVLLLGVTAEIADLPWPSGVRLLAADGSFGMIRAFWPGRVPGRRAAMRTDWDRLPLREESLDFVIGDGVFNTKRYPDGYLELGRRIRSLLRPGGSLFVRGFTQLDDRERPEQVLAAYHAGEAVDYHALRFRFATSLQASAAEGVWLSKEYIDQELSSRGVSLDELYRRSGYEPPPPRRDARPAKRNLVSYPTLREFERVLGACLRPIGLRRGDHPLAHRCPIFGLERAD